ncbi:hypothetical protein [Tenacibaculum caenipelagi]|uniref:hypothetical protein n=1 Tax=Tenacibaculum caenipelagi TaxID=1325435 RepID=UPI0010603F92|nr:hypothetical protein [Tenacibaculum caenipelagi]
MNQKLAQVLKNGIISFLIFWSLIIGISAIEANIKIVDCTACNDGNRKLNWNEINYGLILGTSAIISIIPNLIRIIKPTKKPLYNNI